MISSGVQSLGKIGKELKDVLTIASGGVSGGISASIAGGNFWAGVRQGLITSGLNHVAHSTLEGDDNGYDKDGNKINDNGGDFTDYLYDENGNIIESKFVFQTHNMTPTEFNNSGYENFRGYGYKVNRLLLTYP